nr:lipoma-preferred partner isoform X2 [Zootoca vivipara]
MFHVQVSAGGKTLEERRSSLDAEIDSLTSILADLENSSPYKPRTQQGSGIPGGSPIATPPMATPVTGHKRMVIPNQPPLTATKKSTSKPGAQPIPVTPVGTLKPQPVPASYSTASTPNRPTFNVQVKSAQPAPHFQPPAPQYSSLAPNQAPQPVSSLGPAPYVPSQPRAADYGYAPQTAPHPEPSYGYGGPQGRYQEPAYPGGYGGRNGSDPSYVPQNAWKPEATYPSPGSAALNPAGQYPSSGAKKTYITEPAAGPQPPLLQPKSGHGGPNPASSAPLFRPEDELEHLTKKMLYDMENPPSQEYFGGAVKRTTTKATHQSIRRPCRVRPMAHLVQDPVLKVSKQMPLLGSSLAGPESKRNRCPAFRSIADFNSGHRAELAAIESPLLPEFVWLATVRTGCWTRWATSPLVSQPFVFCIFLVFLKVGHS